MCSRGLLVLVACFGAVSAQSPEAPTTMVPNVVRARCLMCHGIDLIQQQRLNRVGWDRELDKMIRWGAVVPKADREPLLEYLEATAGFSKAPLPPSADGPGALVFAQRCLGCHGSDIVEQQRLGIAAWRREVDKMVGWGARVDPKEIEPLAAYLAGRFGVR